MKSNALWGSGRGGEHRSNALWGKGGKTFVTTALALVALAIPFGAGAETGTPAADRTYVAPGLLKLAKELPNGDVRVIIQSRDGADGAEKAFKGAGFLKRRLDAAGAVAVELKAKQVEHLATKSGLIITPDNPVRLYDAGNGQIWRAATGLLPLLDKAAVTCATDFSGLLLDPACVASPAVVAPQAPTIAIVDSGVERRADFGFYGRIAADVSFTTLAGNTAGDGRGHGTFVASLAAGEASSYAGAAPNAKLVSLDVMNDEGRALVSDVIAAVDWILANKAAHNIRVANFSLGAPASASFRHDPFNRAVQKLWFSGVVVVASAGNYGVNGAATTVKNVPANDPFVITVGASDPMATASAADDLVAPWSAHGRTHSGFKKPELSATGRYLVAAVPAGSTLALERADKVVAPGYMRLSGTSFSAAIVSGAAAQILARRPNWTPDQVKGALMVSATALPLVANFAGGVGEVNAAAAAAVASPPNPNVNLNAFVVADPAGGSIPVFNGDAWYLTASTTPGWAQAGWAEAGWAEAGWSEAGWAEAGWAEAGWAEAGWAEAGWAEAGWAESIANVE